MAADHSEFPPLYTLRNYTSARNVGRHLVDVAAHMRRLVDRRAAPLGISGAQWVVLTRIASGAGSSVSELCWALGHDSGSMTRMLDRLEKAGLISRRRYAGDRRVVKVFLTNRGEKLYPQLAPVGIAALNQTLKGFTDEEEEMLMGLLDRILANLNAA